VKPVATAHAASAKVTRNMLMSWLSKELRPCHNNEKN
jgi:hypothetical protein